MNFNTRCKNYLIDLDIIGRKTKIKIRELCELVPLKGFIAGAAYDEMVETLGTSKKILEYVKEYGNAPEELYKYLILAYIGEQVACGNPQMCTDGQYNKYVAWWINNLINAEKRRPKLDSTSKNYDVLSELRHRLTALEEEILILAYRPFGKSKRKRLTVEQIAAKYKCSCNIISFILESATSKIQDMGIVDVRSEVPKTYILAGEEISETDDEFFARIIKKMEDNQ